MPFENQLGFNTVIFNNKATAIPFITCMRAINFILVLKTQDN